MRRYACVAGLFLAIAVLHTWPIGRAPWRLSLNYHADAELNTWIVSWIPHALATDPRHLFDANIFAPERNTLAYSEPLVVPALVGAPIRAAGGSPVLTFNLLIIAGLVLTACSGWWLAWKWTGSATAALTTGALMAFNVHVLTRLAHLTAEHAWGLPLVWYFADRIVAPRDGRVARRDVIGLAIVIAAVAATSVYWLALAGVIVAVVAVSGGLGVRRLAALGAASVAGLAVASPILLPYVRLAASGTTRPIEMVAQFSATPAGYLASTSHVHAGWTSRFFTNDVNVLFAGVAALALAGLGLMSLRNPRRRAFVIVAIAAVGVVLSLGPATAVYRWLYDWVPPLQGLRAAARFGYLYLMAVAIAAGLGVAWIERRLRSPRASRVAAAAALVLVTLEAWQSPLHTTPFTRVPRIYSLLAEASAPVRLVEVPFYPPEMVDQNAEYVLNSTAHWQPLMNGYSGFTPDSYRRLTESFWRFPEDVAIQAIRREGATHVMVHLEKFGAEAPGVVRALDGQSSLWLVASDPEGHRLYLVQR